MYKLYCMCGSRDFIFHFHLYLYLYLLLFSFIYTSRLSLVSSLSNAAIVGRLFVVHDSRKYPNLNASPSPEPKNLPKRRLEMHTHPLPSRDPDECNCSPNPQTHNNAAKIPPPMPVPSRVIPPTRTLLHWNGAAPAAPALFLLLLLPVANPPAALSPVAVGLKVAAPPVPVAVAVTPILGFPLAVCVTAASLGADVALGTGGR